MSYLVLAPSFDGNPEYDSQKVLGLDSQKKVYNKRVMSTQKDCKTPLQESTIHPTLKTSYRIRLDRVPGRRLAGLEGRSLSQSFILTLSLACL
jgi:hypothetical protein